MHTFVRGTTWEFRGPGRPYTPPARAEEADQDGDTRRRAALEAPRCADARQLPHEQPEIEPAHLHEQTFEDIGMAAQMHPAHAPGFVQM